MSQPRQRLLGLAATISLLLMVIGTPAALIALGTTPWQIDLVELGNRLRSPDDSTMALVVIGIAAWLAWAVMTLCVVIESAARIRGISAPTLPGLHLPQFAAGQLVAVASMLFVAVPVVASFPPPPAHAATPPQTHVDAPPLSGARSLSQQPPSPLPSRRSPNRPSRSEPPSTTPSNAATASGKSRTDSSATAHGTSRCGSPRIVEGFLMRLPGRGPRCSRS